MGDNVNDRDELFMELGITVPAYHPAEEAPPVDHVRLRALARRELVEQEAHELCVLMAKYKSWSDAFGTILRESTEETERPDDYSVLAAKVIEAIEDILDGFVEGVDDPDALDVRAITESAVNAAIDDNAVDREIKLKLFLVAANCIRDAVKDFAVDSQGQASAATAKASADETLIQMSRSNPRRVLARISELETLRQINSFQADVYGLSKFAGRGRREIAGLMECPYTEIKKQLALATAEVERV